MYEAYADPPGIIAGVVILAVLSTLCVALRFHNRQKQHSRILVSDWLMIPAYICALGLLASEIYAVSIKAFGYPLGSTDERNDDLERIYITLRIQFSNLIIGILGAGLVKLSVTLLYWHLFSLVTLRRFLLIWITVTIAWTGAFIIAALAVCGTHFMARFSLFQDYAQYCSNYRKVGYGYVATDILTDLITLIIPIPVVLSLQLSVWRKAGVMATFLVGGLAVGASIAKGYMYITANLNSGKADGLLLMTAFSIWNLVEVHVGIIAACTMTLRPLLSDALRSPSVQSILRWSRSSRSRSSRLSDQGAESASIRPGDSLERVGETTKKASIIVQGEN